MRDWNWREISRKSHVEPNSANHGHISDWSVWGGFLQSRLQCSCPQGSYVNINKQWIRLCLTSRDRLTRMWKCTSSYHRSRVRGKKTSVSVDDSSSMHISTDVHGPDITWAKLELPCPPGIAGPSRSGGRRWNLTRGSKQRMWPTSTFFNRPVRSVHMHAHTSRYCFTTTLPNVKIRNECLNRFRFLSRY